MGKRDPERNRGARHHHLRHRSASAGNNVAYSNYTNHWLPALTALVLGSLFTTMSPIPSELSVLQSAPKWFDLEDLEWLFTDMSFTNSNQTKPMEFDMRKSLGFRSNEFYPPTVEETAQSALLYPLLTENLPTVLNRTPGNDMFPSTSRSNDPSLLDYEAIDIFWRRDIDAEKGAPWADQQSPIYDQSERDIQVLSEKMYTPSFGSEYQYSPSHGSSSPFSDSENSNIWLSTPAKLSSFWRFENIGNGPTSSTSSDSGCPSSDDYEFEASGIQNLLKNSNLNRDRNAQPLQEHKIEHVPREVSAHQPQNEFAFRNASFLPVESPIVQNVSLFSADIHPINETDTSFDQLSQEQQSDDYLYNDLVTDPNLTPFDPQLNSDAFSSLFGSTGINANNEEFPSDYSNPADTYTDASRSETELATSFLDSLMNTDQENNQEASVKSENSENEWREDGPSSSQSSSPRSSSSSSPSTYESRFFDKLAPLVESNDPNLLRGRQSVDDQLARMHNLPFTPLEITNWSFQELQRNIRTISLTDVQKELIRKIRRRGKNKVAARACRKRKETLLRFDIESDFCDPMDEQEKREDAIERQRQLLEALTLQWKDMKRSA